MATPTQSDTGTSERTAAIPSEPVWRLSVEQYHRMICLGILTADDPVELLEGWLVYKMPKNPPHRVTTKLVRTALEAIAPSGWYVDTQEPITLADSEPEPDAVIIRGNTRDYLERHPSAADVALVVEIADSTLERDRTFKQRLYARAGIPVYWVINLVESCIEVYTQPLSDIEIPGYQHVQVYSAKDVIALVIAEEAIAHLSVRELLP